MSATTELFRRKFRLMQRRYCSFPSRFPESKEIRDTWKKPLGQEGFDNQLQFGLVLEFQGCFEACLDHRCSMVKGYLYSSFLFIHQTEL